MPAFKPLRLAALCAVVGMSAVFQSHVALAAPVPTVTQLTAIALDIPPHPLATYTITVRTLAPEAGVPTGEVELVDGSTVLGTATLTDTGGVAAASVSVPRDVAAHPLLARYAGNEMYAPSLSLPGFPPRGLGR